MSKKKYECPHCSERLLLWETPPDSTWGNEPRYVCFNDECPYFVRGWKWMEEKYNQKASYRYCLNPLNGKEHPLPVWSDTALKNSIVDDKKES